MIIFTPLQIVLSQEAAELVNADKATPVCQEAHSWSESPQLVASTKLVPRRCV